VLSVSPDRQDHAAVRRLLDAAVWQVATAESCQEALDYLTKQDVVVVLCEHSLPDGSWKRLLDQAAVLQNPPSIVVTSRLADTHMWAEVLNLGGYDVLAKPLEQTEVRHVLESICLERARAAAPVRVAGANGG